LPIYEYRCDVCGHTLEVFQKFSEDPLETCEVCGGHVAKVLHPVAIHFKGSGFYTTDYGRGSKKARAADAGAKADADAGARAADGAKPDAGAKSADKPKTKPSGDGDGAKKSAGAGGGGAAAASRASTSDKAG
jgi:putative FmdB family regulatory protein